MRTDHAQAAAELVVEEPLLTADEVAAALGVHRKFVYARAASGELRAYKLGPQFRFRPADVRAFLEASIARTAADPEPRERRRPTAPAGTFRALLEGRAPAGGACRGLERHHQRQARRRREQDRAYARRAVAAGRAQGTGGAGAAPGPAGAGGTDHRDCVGRAVERDAVPVVPAASLVEGGSGSAPV